MNTTNPTYQRLFIEAYMHSGGDLTKLAYMEAEALINDLPGYHLLDGSLTTLVIETACTMGKRCL